MQGRRRPRPVHPVVIDLEQLVPRGHRLRRVDSVLDLRFVYSLTKPSIFGSNGTSVYRSSNVFQNGGS